MAENDVPESPWFTPGEYLSDGRTVYALDESGTANRFSAHVDGGFSYRANSYANSIKTEPGEIDTVVRLFTASPKLHASVVEMLDEFWGDGPCACPPVFEDEGCWVCRARAALDQVAGRQAAES